VLLVQADGNQDAMQPCLVQKGRESDDDPSRPFHHKRKTTSKAALKAVKRWITFAKQCVTYTSAGKSR
jgi:hypothetical protein